MQEADKITAPEPPKPVAIGTLYKLSRSSCKVLFKNWRQEDVVASGFFGRVKVSFNKDLTATKKVTTLYGLVTNHHVIGDQEEGLSIKRGNRFYIKCYDPTTSTECPRIPVDIGSHTGFTFTDEALDFTFIELTEIFRRQFLDQHKVDYLALGVSSEKNKKLTLGLSVFVLQFPTGGELKYSSGNVMMLPDSGYIIYTAPTAGGSSGSPVFDFKTNRVIGIHLGGGNNGDPLEKIVADCDQVKSLLKDNYNEASTLIANITSQLQQLREATLKCHRVAVRIDVVVERIQIEVNKLHKLDNKMRNAIQEGDCDRVGDLCLEMNDSGANIEHLRYFDETPLHLAARLGDLRTAECLLNWEPLLLEARTRDARLSALTIAAHHGHVDFVEFLIEKRCASLETSSESENALGAAAFAGQIHVLDVLLEKKQLNLDETKNKKGETCLRRAAAGGNSKCLKHVISVFGAINKEQLDIQDEAGRTALMIAARLGHADCVDVLLDAGANLELALRDEGAAIHLAVREGHVDTIRRFLFHRRGGLKAAKLSSLGVDPLGVAVTTGSLEVVNDLYYFLATQDQCIDKGALFRIDKGALFLIAATTDKSGDVLKFLIRRGAALASAQINLTERNVLHYVRTIAALNIVLDELSSRPDLLKELLLQKDSETGQNPLMTMVNECPGDVKILETFLDAVKVKFGDDFVAQLLDERNKFRQSTLHFLAKLKPNSDSVAVARLLLKHGAKLEAVDHKNRTAAFNAVLLHNCELLQFFLAKDLESAPRILTSPKEIIKLLYTAVLRKRVDMVQWLLLFEEEQRLIGNKMYQNLKLVGLRDDNGNGVLQVACTIGNNADIITLLLQYGANPFEQNVRGQTALHSAVANNHADALLALLDNIGARIGKEALLATFGHDLTMLHVAATKNCDVFIFKALMQYAAEFGCFTELLEAKWKFRTALMIAAIQGYSTLVQYLLDINADIDAREKRTENKAIHFAAAAGHSHVIEVLLNHKNGGLRLLLDQQSHGDTALKIACRFSQMKAVKTLLESAENDVDLSIKQVNMADEAGNTPLFVAVEHGDISIVKDLLRAGAKAFSAGSPLTAFYLAAYRGHFGVFDALIDACPNQEEAKLPNTGETPLLTALAQGQVLFAKRLLAKFGARLLFAKDIWGRSVDCYVTNCKDEAKKEEMHQLLAQVRQAVNEGIPLDAFLASGMTVNQEKMIAAISSRDLGKLYALIEEDHEVLDLRTPSGGTIFHVAAERGNVAVLDVLLTACDSAKRRKLLAVVNSDGETALKVAKSNKDIRVAQKMVRRVMRNVNEI